MEVEEAVEEASLEEAAAHLAQLLPHLDQVHNRKHPELPHSNRRVVECLEDKG